jgi:hypothetical protein
VKIWSRIRLDRYALSEVDEAMDAVSAGRVIKALVDPAR